MAAAHQLDHAMFERSANKLIGTCLRKAQCHADLGIGQSLHPMHLESPPLAHGQFGKRAMKRRSEEHTSELQSLMRISYAVFCLKKNKDALPPSYTCCIAQTNTHTHAQTK